MKKLSFFLIVSLAILGVSCDSKTAPATASDNQQGEPFETVTNIRYVNYDSIMQYYVLAQEVSAQIDQLSLEYNRKRSSFENIVMQKGNNIQQKMQQNLYLNEQSYNNDVNELNRLQSQYAQELSKYEQQAAQKGAELNKMLNDSINNFIIEFNKDRKYDAILNRAAGLYFNPALDITSEVIEGLNARYGSIAKPAAPADTTATK